MNLTLVFNRGGALALVAAIAAWVAVQLLGHDPFRLVAGFGVMALVGLGLELQPRPDWRPRYFWILPAWLLGSGGMGLALRDAGQESLGHVVLGAAGVAIASALGVSMARNPGGRWLAGCVGAGAVVMGFQYVGYAHPEWQHPVLYGVNATALVALVVCGVKLYRVRMASSPACASDRE